MRTSILIPILVFCFLLHPSPASATVQVILTSGTSWTVPNDWTSSANTVETIGAGASAVVNASAPPEVGGGGGAYAKVFNLTLSRGVSITYQVGTASGDTYFNGTGSTCAAQSVCAKGANGIFGGSGASSVGTVTYSGGGAIQVSCSPSPSCLSTNSGAGGAGAAGPSGVGNDASPSSVGKGGSGDNGSGGAGGSTSGTSGSSGAEWGTAGSGGGGGASTSVAGNGGAYGAGGGAAGNGTAAGSGSQGVIVITYYPPVGQFVIYGGAITVKGGRVVVGELAECASGFTLTGTRQCIEIITSGTSFTVPSNWNNSKNTIETIGGGGGAGNGPTFWAGGGGAYAETTNLPLTPGASVTYQIGSAGAGGGASSAGTLGGDTYFNGSGTTCASQSVCAKGGGAGGNGSGGSGGAGGSSVGSLTFSGGSTSGSTNSGGGGAAGPNGAGGNGSNNTGGAGDNGSGGASSGGAGNPGTEWGTAGSGGGGGHNGDGGLYGGGGGTSGGNGAQGVIVVTYIP